ncbi:MAG: carbohydrate kinase family protein [Gammaproteobacteria bacterium]|nr:carbohydrate kinase family protein [Gammaproteobacteria bacterium]
MPDKKYKIAVIGPIPRDHITTYKGQEVDKYGCITHPIVVLSKLFGDEADIYPVTHIRKSDLEPISKIFSDLPGVKQDYIYTKHDGGDIINLRFIDQNERVKTMTGFMPPITSEDIKPLLDSDLFLFLPVTDFEIPLETLKSIKQHSNGITILDAHGPTKTMTVLGDRLLKLWIDRDNWLPYIDVLKMNLNEAKCCWFKTDCELEELEEDEPLPLEEIPNFARHCFKFGVKALYITLDVRGALVYFQDNGDLKEVLVPAVPVDIMNIVDSTGCGDTFAGGLAYSLLTNGDYVEAAKYANVMGAQCLQGVSFESFQPLTEVKKVIENTY